MDDQTWRDFANCKDADPNLFYTDPETTGSEASAQRKQAKAICNNCPVREPCLAYALKHELKGVWGATTERARRDNRKRLGMVLNDPSAGHLSSLLTQRYYEHV